MQMSGTEDDFIGHTTEQHTLHQVDDWWRGALSGHEGWFPANYVQEVFAVPICPPVHQ